MPELTLEQAQDRIVELNEQVQDLTQERDQLLQDNEELNTELEASRTQCQRYFNKLIAQDSAEKNENENDNDEGDDVPTWDDLAKSINI